MQSLGFRALLLAYYLTPILHFTFCSWMTTTNDPALARFAFGSAAVICGLYNLQRDTRFLVLSKTQRNKYDCKIWTSIGKSRASIISMISGLFNCCTHPSILLKPIFGCAVYFYYTTCACCIESVMWESLLRKGFMRTFMKAASTSEYTAFLVA